MSVLASHLWRRDKLVAYLKRAWPYAWSRRSRHAQPGASSGLSRQHRQLPGRIDDLPLDPVERFSLGLQLKQLRSDDRFDASRLTRDEQADLDRLLTKARVRDD